MDRRSCNDLIGVSILDHNLRFVIVLVLNFAYKFFDNIFERYNSYGTTIFADHNSHLHFLLLKLSEKMIDRLVLGDKIGLMRNLKKTFVGLVDEMEYNILSMNDTFDLIEVV